MKRTTEVVLPDGSVATRSSETKHYTHAVVMEEDRRGKAARLRAEADQIEQGHRVAVEIIESGELSRFGRKHSSSNGWGERFYSSTVPGYEDQYWLWLPDWRDPAEWDQYADKALARIAEHVQKLRAEADRLATGPQFAYGVLRWSERRDSAEKARREFQGSMPAENKFSVVEVQERTR